MMNRRTFFTKKLPLLVGMPALLTGNRAFSKNLASKGDPLPPEMVNEFVRKGHGDLEGTQKLLAEQPGLLNATWDWGGGDFETALGGASHMGRPDIAEYLIRQGARMDIFAAAMLGKLEVVKMMVAAYPELIASVGPHGISLLKHAVKGGENARPVLEFLQSKGIEK